MFNSCERETISPKLLQSLSIESSSKPHVFVCNGLGARASMDSAFRALVFSVYLNDVKEGGETEFLNQAMRIKPKKGRVVVFPAGFPYVHRGNQPMKGEKYLMTSWFLLPKI